MGLDAERRLGRVAGRKTPLAPISRKPGLAHPTRSLYTSVKDARKGQTNGEEVDAFGAEWYAVSAAGAKVEKHDATSSSGGDPTPTGYGY